MLSLNEIEKHKLGLEIVQEGHYEEFYQKGDVRGNGKNPEMQQWHKNRRLKLQKQYNALQAD